MTESVERDAAAAWQFTMNPVLRGLNHEFSNLLTALGGVALVSTAGSTPGIGGDHLAKGIDRLDGLLRLYRLLPFAARENAEPVVLADILPDALQLLKRHLELRLVRCEVEGVANLPPVLVHPSAITQAVLLCLCAAARTLPRSDPTAGLHIRCDGDADWVQLVAETTVSAERPEHTERAPVAAEPTEFVALRWLLRGVEATAELSRSDAGRVRSSLRLATLLRSRTGERRQSPPC